MVAKPIRALELHYPMIQFFIKLLSTCHCMTADPNLSTYVILHVELTEVSFPKLNSIPKKVRTINLKQSLSLFTKSRRQ